MPFVICVALLKGGVSKTTTAIALGEASALWAPTVVIDGDPMGSASRWGDLAAASGQPLQARIDPRPRNLAQHIHSPRLGAEVVIIDTPPPGALDQTDEAVRVADRVVCRCRRSWPTSTAYRPP